jgi:hypothetical protein
MVIKNSLFWDVTPCSLVYNKDVSEKRFASTLSFFDADEFIWIRIQLIFMKVGKWLAQCRTASVIFSSCHYPLLYIQ